MGLRFTCLPHTVHIPRLPVYLSASVNLPPVSVRLSTGIRLNVYDVITRGWTDGCPAVHSKVRILEKQPTGYSILLLTL